METNFDLDFYLNMYPDIKENGLITYKQAYNHYKNYGKLEGRCCNSIQMLDKYKRNIEEQLTNFNKEVQENDESNTINIVVRTHLRKAFFNKAIQSITEQSYMNYIIHVIYDHNDSLNYIQKWSNELGNKLQIHKMVRSSDSPAFFDLYCEEVKNNIHTGWIMFLDDDNYLFHKDCLKIINNYIYMDTKIILWSFLRPDKLLKPRIYNIVFGDIDNCSYIFHNSIKNDSSFGDYYGSDYSFIKGIIDKHKDYVQCIDYTMVSTQYTDVVSHCDTYMVKDPLQLGYIDSNRIDFEDYRNHYDDLKHLNIKQLQNHYDNFGKYESRVVKFKDFQYELLENTINNYITFHKSKMKYILITTLYNEENRTRLYEYILCLKHNQNNQFIDKIVIFYDNNRGNNEELFRIFDSYAKIQIILCNLRPKFKELFDFSNEHFPNLNIIITNADIVFDHSLSFLENGSWEKKIYALSRWDFIDEHTPKPRIQQGEIMTSSKDTWIFKTPIDIICENEEYLNVKIGTWNCDGILNHFLEEYIVHECLNIRSYHIHFCNGRTVKDDVITY